MIHTFPQNSEQWEDARKGKLTSSKVGHWLIAEPRLTLNKEQVIDQLIGLGIPHKKSAKAGDLASLLPDDVRLANQGYLKGDQAARRRMMCQLIGEEEGKSWTEEWTGNRYTDHGNETEPVACESFELETGLKATPIGFVSLGDFPIGASPDRMVYQNDADPPIGILEVKCKTPTVHVETLVEGKLPPEHEMQVHFQMVVCGVSQAWFYAYSPDMQSLTIHIEANDLTERIKRGINAFDRDYTLFRGEHLSRIQLSVEC